MVGGVAALTQPPTSVTEESPKSYSEASFSCTGLFSPWSIDAERLRGSKNSALHCIAE